MRVLSGHTKDVRAVAYAPDGRLLSGGGDKRVILWDSASGNALETLKTRCIVYAIAVSPDGSTAIIGGRPGDRLWQMDLSHESPGACLPGPAWPPVVTEARPYIPSMTLQGSVWSLSFSADGEWLAGASRIMGSGGDLDGFRARWWRGLSFADGDELAEKKVYAVGFAPAGTNLAVTREWSVLLLDRPDGKEILNYKMQSTWAASVAFIPQTPTLVVAASSYLHFVDTTGASKAQRVKSGFRSITSIAVSPEGRWLVVGGRPERLEFYDLSTRVLTLTLDFGLGVIHAVACSPDRGTFAVGGAKGLMVGDLP